MYRSFIESLEYFATSPSLRTVGLFSTVQPQLGNKCEKERCERDNYLTDLVCRACGRSPQRVNQVYWALITFFILAFNFMYTFGRQFFLRQFDDVFSYLLIAFLLCFSISLHLMVFKGTFPSAKLTIWGVFLVLATFGTVPVFQSDQWSGVFFGAIGITLGIVMIAGILVGSQKFCALNRLSLWIPFFIVLPVNFLLISLLLNVPFVHEYTTPIKTLVLSSIGDLPVIGSYTNIILKVLEISTEVRLMALFAYLTVILFGPGIMEAIKARVAGDLNIFEYGLQKAWMAARNVANSFRPIVVTWLWINFYAIASSLLTPLLYLAVLGSLFIMIMRPAGPSHEFFADTAFILAVMATIPILLAAFVVLAAGYSLRVFRAVYADLAKAAFNLLLWVIPTTVVVDILFNGLQIDTTKAIAMLFLFILLLYAVVFRGRLLKASTS